MAGQAVGLERAAFPPYESRIVAQVMRNEDNVRLVMKEGAILKNLLEA